MACTGEPSTISCMPVALVWPSRLSAICGRMLLHERILVRVVFLDGSNCRGLFLACARCVVAGCTSVRPVVFWHLSKLFHL